MVVNNFVIVNGEIDVVCGGGLIVLHAVGCLDDDIWVVELWTVLDVLLLIFDVIVGEMIGVGELLVILVVLYLYDDSLFMGFGNWFWWVCVEEICVRCLIGMVG